jgi:hypothetical protein
MARPSRPAAFLIAAGLLLAALPAVAQFGPIFREELPRPPADIPDRRPLPNNVPTPLPPPPDFTAPARRAPSPVPATLPPAGRPPAGPIQSQPLPPPPGGTAAPAEPARPGGAPAPGQQEAAPAPVETTLPPTEVVVEPPPQRIANPTAVFSGLDKITGRITSFDVAIDETVQFGALRVKPRVCYSRPPTETPRTDAFLEVDEVTLQGEVRRIFTGWMFAASPGLHAVEHPIYDVWLADCKGGTLATAESDEGKPGQERPPSTAQRRR